MSMGYAIWEVYCEIQSAIVEAACLEKVHILVQ